LTNTAGICGTVPVWRSIPYREFRYVRYGVLNRTENFGTFGLEFYTLPKTSVRSARCPYPYRRYRYDTPYRYREARYVRYDAHTGTENFGTFGTMSIPLPRISVRSVPCPYRYRAYPYRTEHTLGIWVLVTGFRGVKLFRRVLHPASIFSPNPFFSPRARKPGSVEIGDMDAGVLHAFLFSLSRYVIHYLGKK